MHKEYVQHSVPTHRATKPVILSHFRTRMSHTPTTGIHRRYNIKPRMLHTRIILCTTFPRFQNF